MPICVGCAISIDRAPTGPSGRDRPCVSTDSLEDVLADSAVEAVAIATPAATHVDVGLACIEAGKHVMIEKPLALSSAEAEKLVAAARDADVVLMCDHTYCYTPAVRKIRALVREGALGRSAVLRLGPDQSRARTDRRRRLLGSGASRPVDPRLHPSRRGIAVEAVAARARIPIGAGQSCARLPDAASRPGEPSRTSTSTGSARRRSARRSSGVPSASWCGTTSPDAAPEHVRQGGRAERRAGRRCAKRKRSSHIASATWWRPLSPRARRSGGRSEFVGCHPRGPAHPLTDGESGLRVLRILEAVDREHRARGRHRAPST